MVFTLYGVWLPTVLSVPKVGSNGSRLYAMRRNAHVNFVFKSHSHSWKFFAGKSSNPLFQSSTATASDKVLVPGTENEETLFSTEESEVAEIGSDDSQACQFVLTSAKHNPFLSIQLTNSKKRNIA